MRMVLVGKTGSGKSATGNAIAGETIFQSVATGNSVTKKCKQYTFTREGQELQIIDVPGFCDVHLSEETIKIEISTCIAMSSPGLHAILFVIRVGRYTEEDIKTLDQFIRCFGEEAVNYVTVIITGEDDLKADKKNVDHFILNSPNSLKNLLKKVGNRYIVVNNRGSKKEKAKFVHKLLTCVSGMVRSNGGRCYTNEMYKKAEEELKKKREEERKRIAEEQRANDEKIIQATKKGERERVIRELEEKHRREATKNVRENIGKGIGGVSGGLAGATISFIGSEAFEYIGTVVGLVVGGPTGAVVGKAVGGIAGYLTVSTLTGVLGSKLGGAIAK